MPTKKDPLASQRAKIKTLQDRIVAQDAKKKQEQEKAKNAQTIKSLQAKLTPKKKGAK